MDLPVLEQLDLPDHGVKTKHGPNGVVIFDPCRKRWLALNPEEWVRQHFLNHLMHDLKCPVSLMATERTLSLNGLTKRVDILVHGRNGIPLALVECKAPSVKLTDSTFAQAARYNSVFRVPFLIITNGLRHFACHVDHVQGDYTFMDHIPDHSTMEGAALA